MRITLPLLLLVACTALTGCATSENEGWHQLFNGEDLEDWTIKIRGHELGENFANTFRVEDGLLKVRYDQYENGFEEKFGHIFYKDSYSTYLLGAEYRFVGEQIEGGAGWAFRNNGLMLHGQDPATMEIDQDFPNSIEVQLLGGYQQGERPTANVCTPGTHLVMDGDLITNHCTNSHSKTFPGDQWVRVDVLVVRDSLFVHYVNGEEVMHYEKPQLDDGTPLKEGTISLQSESHPTDFRTVELYDLKEYEGDPRALREMVSRLLKERNNR